MDSYNIKESRKRTFAILLVMNGLWHFGNEWSKLVFPYITWDTDPRMDMVDIGYLNGFGNLCIFIGSLLQGHLLDSVGTRISAILSSAFHGLYICATSQGRSFLSLCAIQPLRAVVNFQLIAETQVCRITIEKERTSKLMLLSVPAGVAMLAGPYAASYLSVHFDLRNLQMICGVLMLATLLPVSIALLPETESVHQRSQGQAFIGQSFDAFASKLRFSDYKDMLGDKKFLKTLLIKLLIVLPYFAYETFSRQYLISRFVVHPTDMAKLFIVMGITVILTNTVLMYYVKDKFTPKQLFNASVLLLAVSYVIQSQINSYDQMLLAMPLHVIGISITMAETSTQITAAVEKSRMGIAIGVSHSIAIFASIVQPTILGYVVQQYGFATLCYAGAGFSMVAFVLVQFYGSYMNNRLVQLPSVFGVGIGITHGD